MGKILKIRATCLLLAILTAGCALPQPVPFKLVDSRANVQWGTLFPNGQRLEVIVEGHLFKGFYLISSGTAFSQTFGGRRHFPNETITTYSSNSARAHLSADNGQQLNCEFLFEFRRAVGECHTPSGEIYQLNADESTPKN